MVGLGPASLDAATFLQSMVGLEPASRRIMNRAASDDKVTFNFQLDEARMRSGEDPRTTLMIRNIPNKYSLHFIVDSFKYLFRENFGLFDFLYLPMDNQNNCNLGYAFINIREQSKVPIFYDKMNNKVWDPCNIHKNCAIHYAEEQGFANLLDFYAQKSAERETQSSRMTDPESLSRTTTVDGGAEHVKAFLFARDVGTGLVPEKTLILATDRVANELQQLAIFNPNPEVFLLRDSDGIRSFPLTVLHAHQETERAHQGTERIHQGTDRIHQETERAHQEMERTPTEEAMLAILNPNPDVRSFLLSATHAHQETERAHQVTERIHPETERSHQKTERAHREMERTPTEVAMGL